MQEIMSTTLMWMIRYIKKFDCHDPIVDSYPLLLLCDPWLLMGLNLGGVISMTKIANYTAREIFDEIHDTFMA